MSKPKSVCFSCGFGYKVGEMKVLGKTFKVSLNEAACKACGICVALCPKKVLAARHDGKAEVVDEAACIGCQNCSVHCPDFCFVVKEADKND